MKISQECPPGSGSAASLLPLLGGEEHGALLQEQRVALLAHAARRVRRRVAHAARRVSLPVATEVAQNS